MMRFRRETHPLHSNGNITVSRRSGDVSTLLAVLSQAGFRSTLDAKIRGDDAAACLMIVLCPPCNRNRCGDWVS